MTLYWSTLIFSLAGPDSWMLHSNIGCPGDPSTGRTTGVFPLGKPPGTFYPLLQTADPGKPQTYLEGGVVLVKDALGTWTSACLLFVERVRGAKSRRVEPRGTVLPQCLVHKPQ